MPAEQPLGPEVDWRPVAAPAREVHAGSRVVVRPLDPARDAEPFFAATHPPAAEPSLWAYLHDGPYESAAQLRAMMEAIEPLADPRFFSFDRLPDRRPLGRAAYMRIDTASGVIEIGGILLAPELQRTTAATEAIFLLIRHAFDELGYRRLEWKCDALNAPSRRAAERYGFRFEGIFRQHMVIKGRNRDTAWFAITDQEWPRIRAGFEAWLAPDNFDPAGAQKRHLASLIDASRG
jgi:RimJ/RimL family protein N-acetyltransferase